MSVILISEYEIMICIMKGFYEIIRVTKKLYEWSFCIAYNIYTHFYHIKARIVHIWLSDCIIFLYAIWIWLCIWLILKLFFSNDFIPKTIAKTVGWVK